MKAQACQCTVHLQKHKWDTEIRPRPHNLAPFVTKGEQLHWNYVTFMLLTPTYYPWFHLLLYMYDRLLFSIHIHNKTVHKVSQTYANSSEQLLHNL